ERRQGGTAERRETGGAPVRRRLVRSDERRRATRAQPAGGGDTRCFGAARPADHDRLEDTALARPVDLRARRRVRAARNDQHTASRERRRSRQPQPARRLLAAEDATERAGESRRSDEQEWPGPREEAPHRALEVGV